MTTAGDRAADVPADGPANRRRVVPRNRDELGDRVLTLPNLLSVVRLLGVPLFLWLLLGPHADGWAIVVLAVSGATDWLDGKLARALGQASRLGALLDPAADRLYIVATLIAFVIRDVVPLWVVVVLLVREAVLAVTLLVLRRAGWPPLQVHYLGKAATFLLLYAFPLLLLADGAGPVAGLVQPVAYALTVWGAALYLLAGVFYVVQAAQLLSGRSPAGVEA
ncbi:CDP-alcohol phosphatidyltransferase family protein [Modestobacter marinus]|uniref:CDP-diacylglycerol--glycerol-3-phosphate 3-phosphatidyltransferase n=1 Tax=Modestobacter marinus TaxID=477641 RepID=A0A846LS85_9ACTN|nr:CDP-alcohol phosphatidyltransferase family protein [Modestobacter marinus]NIH69142.1 cardiolipin synthase [Modestobacter marinus]GGL77272.1 CDP-diacylglycerol--glycerol-3-phosphate 3-phosphatidyltransferase [Modestobacter marinus]